VNRVGDFGFVLGIAGVVYYTAQFGGASLDYFDAFKAAPQIAGQTFALPGTDGVNAMTFICICLFIGAMGKSAQVPLHVWLPDSMEGPTPISALIHAATMVTAGIFMVARMSPLFEFSEVALNFVLFIGATTALFMGFLGIINNDIKRVVAYSTLSQLGYMTVALGASAYSFGIFHLMTHAFFKALLFLGAGSVIHALSGEQDLREMGGLARKIPITCGVLLCASLAIAGVPATSGYFSKDLILESAYSYAPWMYWVGVLTAGMTAFYVFRAFFMAFFGEYRGHEHHPHESPFVMWGPLAILAVLSLGGGFINIPKYLEPLFPVSEGVLPSFVGWTPAAVGIGGIALAYVFYVLAPALPKILATAFGPVYTLLYNKYFIDEAYDSAVVNPTIDGSRSLLWRTFDAGTIDGAVNGVGKTARALGSVLRLPQSGYIRSYAGWVVAGAILVVIVMGLGQIWPGATR
jgi:NADH-quinone oxidoreductase subunit L